MAGIKLRSPAFGNNDPIPAKYSYEGGDISPPLDWTGVPDDTVELALTCEDPDAPGGTFVHWLLAKIPASVTGIAEGESPQGAIPGNNHFGTQKYAGPHPPHGHGPHRYVFRVYALGAQPDVAPGYTADGLRRAMEGKILASGECVGTFERK